MRSSKQRQRNKQNRTTRPSGGNIVNRVFDSSGPEGKVRGTPAQIIEKYAQLHRDAQLSGDRVGAENFAQHAEHYTRLLAEAQRDIDRVREEQEQFQRDRQAQERPAFDRPNDRGGNGQGDRPAFDRPNGERQPDRQPDRQSDRQSDRQPERAFDRPAGPSERSTFEGRERERAARLRAQEEAAAAPAPAPDLAGPDLAGPDLADAGFLRAPLFPTLVPEPQDDATGLVETPEDRARDAEAPAAPVKKAPRSRTRRPRPPEAAPADAAE